MNTRAHLVLATLLLLSICSRAELRLGTAAQDITPPTGTPLAGYYHERGADGVADPIFAKAAVLSDGTTTAALVVCDLITMPRFAVDCARLLITEQTGIPGQNILLAATHSHTGPVLVRDSALDEVVGATNNLARNYSTTLPAAIATAVSNAFARLAPSQISFSRQDEPRLSFNRRFWMRDGSVGWNPGKRNPEILRPVAGIDPEVGIVYAEDTARKPQLTFVNFAMHPDTTGGTRVSADYPGALARRLADYRGADMLTIFANGACGDINHVNVEWASAQTSTNEANRLGTILAAAVLEGYTDLIPVPGTALLRVRSETVKLPVAACTPEELKQAQDTAAQGVKAKFMDRVQAYKVLDAAARQGKPFEVEVQVIGLGQDLAWVSLPGEIFVDLGLNIKAASPFRQTHIVALANGAIGYIPNRSAYAQGNYEVLSARCAAGSGELLVMTAIKLLKELRAEQVKP